MGRKMSMFGGPEIDLDAIKKGKTWEDCKNEYGISRISEMTDIQVKAWTNSGNAGESNRRFLHEAPEKIGYKNAIKCLRDAIEQDSTAYWGTYMDGPVIDTGKEHTPSSPYAFGVNGFNRFK